MLSNSHTLLCVGKACSQSSIRPQRIVCLGTNKNINLIQQKIISQVIAYEYTPGERFAIVLSLEEALRNAITHGNHNDDSKCVEVVFLVSKFGIWVRIEDEGRGFRPELLRNPCDNGRLDQTHGRGVFLMREFMHRVSYNHRGNAVTMELIREQRKGREHGT